jgi:hypothetical protein
LEDEVITIGVFVFQFGFEEYTREAEVREGLKVHF